MYQLVCWDYNLILYDSSAACESLDFKRWGVLFRSPEHPEHVFCHGEIFKETMTGRAKSAQNKWGFGLKETNTAGEGLQTWQPPPWLALPPAAPTPESAAFTGYSTNVYWCYFPISEKSSCFSRWLYDQFKWIKYSKEKDAICCKAWRHFPVASHTESWHLQELAVVCVCYINDEAIKRRLLGLWKQLTCQQREFHRGFCKCLSHWIWTQRYAWASALTVRL